MFVEDKNSMSAPQRSTLGQRKSIRHARQQRRRKIWAAITAFAIALPIVSSLAMPAVAADDKGEYLEVTKSVDKVELEPGQSFTYSIDVVCSQESCVSAQLTDPLPAELDGLDRKSTRLNSSHVAISYAVFCLKKKGNDYRCE